MSGWEESKGKEMGGGVYLKDENMGVKLGKIQGGLKR